MLISNDIFAAFLKCETKVHLYSTSHIGAHSEFTDWREHLQKEFSKRGLTPHYTVIAVCLRCGGEDFVGTRDHTRSMSSRFPMGLRDARSRRQRFGKTTSGLVTHDEPPLSHEDRRLGRFPSREGEGPQRCVRGRLRVLAQRQWGIKSRWPLQSGIFSLAFRATYPQIAP